MTHLLWVALHSMAQSFIELDKAVVHVISLVSFPWLSFSFCFTLRLIRIRGLCKLPDGQDRLLENLGLILVGEAMLSKCFICFFFFFVGRECVFSLLFGLIPNYGRCNGDNGTTFIRPHSGTAALSAPSPAVSHLLHGPRLLQRFLDIHSQVWVYLLWGRCSLLLCPGVQKALFVPSLTVFP